jgi:FixJ family two-component response regulator
MLVDSTGWRSSLFASAEALLESGKLDEDDCLVPDLKMPGMIVEAANEVEDSQRVGI